MRPQTLSATATHVYDLCPKRFEAEKVTSVPTKGGKAADLGTAVHDTLERAILNFDMKPAGMPLDYLIELWDDVYSEYFPTEEFHDEGKVMLEDWWHRQDWSDREVLSCEVKEFFPLNTPPGEGWMYPDPTDADPKPSPVSGGDFVKFNYIWDRADRRPSTGDIEIVDYKSSRIPITPDKLKNLIQARCYALAAQLKYPDAPRIWVVYEMMRYDAVGAVFTTEENRRTWKWLQNVVYRIWADDDPREVLNDECRWCVRSGGCDTLMRVAAQGGLPAINNPHMAADRRGLLFSARKALNDQITELDDYLMETMDQNGTTEIETPTTRVTLNVRGRRKVDAQRVIDLLGADKARAYVGMTVTEFDRLVKSGELTEEEVLQIKQFVRSSAGKASIKTEHIGSVEEI